MNDIELIKRSWYIEGYDDRNQNKEPRWLIENLQFKDNPNYGQRLPAEQSDNIGKHKEQPEANGLPNKRTRVNYAICELQAFKPLREAIVLDSYVYDEGKCYRENLLNYIHAIPESRLAEIRSYLKENGWWPYDDDADWMKHERPEMDLEKFTEKIKTFQGRYKHPEIVSVKGAMAFMARMFYQYPNVARLWYEQLPKVTMD